MLRGTRGQAVTTVRTRPAKLAQPFFPSLPAVPRAAVNRHCLNSRAGGTDDRIEPLRRNPLFALVIVFGEGFHPCVTERTRPGRYCEIG